MTPCYSFPLNITMLVHNTWILQRLSTSINYFTDFSNLENCNEKSLLLDHCIIFHVMYSFYFSFLNRFIWQKFDFWENCFQIFHNSHWLGQSYIIEHKCWYLNFLSLSEQFDISGTGTNENFSILTWFKGFIFPYSDVRCWPPSLTRCIALYS